MKHLELRREQIEGTILAYSIPETKEYLLATIGEINSADNNSNLADFDFVFSPFDSNSLPTLCFKISSLASGRKFSCYPESSTDNISTSFQAYTALFNQAMKQIEVGDISKAVLSKVKVVANNNSDLYYSFIKLKNTYPAAFTYLLHIPGFGTWLGVSPELVLSSDGSTYKSRAIAGTKQNDINLSWTEKEYQEHAFVEEHYRDVLTSNKIDFNISARYTHKAGKISHLCSDITIEQDNRIDMGSLLEAIHPGPALSGYPKDASIKVIKALEPHDREYYCGYLGPVSSDGSLQLYANIRCMKAYKNALVLFVGGGITCDSVLENEWKETELKSETLTSVLSRVPQTSEIS